jgi:Mg2+-importing ATPase
VSAPGAVEAPWSLPTAELMTRLETGPEGLPPAEAAARLRRDGPNAVRDETAASWVALLLRQFQSPLVLFLVFAGVIAGGLRQWIDAGIILAMVLGSTLLGFAQEHRASRAVAELKRRLTLMVKVRRGGRIISIPAADVVVGDVVQLAAGAIVPADAVVAQGKDLLVSEAALTGESFPVEKSPGACPADAQVAGRTNCVFLGTSVRSGAGEAVVVATGRRTEFGDIAEQLRTKPIETDFARGIRRFGYMLVRVMIAIVLFVLIVNQLLGRPFIDSLLFSVALGLGMSPELLPAIISVTLSAGATRLASRGVIVRQLEAIENLGGMTVFCTDKTGTLTEGQIRMVDAVDPHGKTSDSVRLLGYLNAVLEAGIENPLDQAVVAAGQAAGLTADGYEKRDEVPYDFTRKRLSVIVQAAGSSAPQLITKGAVDNVLALCSRVAAAGKDAPLDGERLEAIRTYCEDEGKGGLRLLAVATRTLPVRERYGVADEDDLRLEGFLVFLDPPKAEAADAISELSAMGVAVKVISGDNRHVVRHVAEAVGLKDPRLLTGAEIAKLKDEALWNRAERATLFAEVDPQQKERIVRALQRRGHSVGYLGDGINDAPALYTADVGISVDQAVDVARESADVVLLKRDLTVLKDGVLGGRRTFANTLKYISITTSANFGNMVSMAFAAPFLPFLPMAAKQILLNNFLSDVPSMAISADSVDADRLQHAQRLSTADIQRFMVVFGLISSAFDLFAFVVFLRVFHTPERVFQTAWFVLSLLTELAVVMVLRTEGPAWRSRPSAVLAWATVAVAALALAVPYAAPLSRLFGFEPLPVSMLALLAALVAAYLAMNEVAKRWFRAARRDPPRARLRARGPTETRRPSSLRPGHRGSPPPDRSAPPLGRG